MFLLKTLAIGIPQLIAQTIREDLRHFGLFGTIGLVISNLLIFGVFALFILPRFLTLWAYGLMGALLIGFLSLLVPQLKPKSTR
jgi:hypothetical protein